MNYGWQAFVVKDWPRNAMRIHLRNREGNTANYVAQIGPGADTVMRTVRSETATGEAPEGMLIPDEAAEALYIELHRLFGGKPNDYQAKYEEARDALEVERRRVDALLTQVAELHAFAAVNRPTS